MDWFLHLLHLLFVYSLLISTTAISDQITKPYVVYMGNSSPNNILESAHLQLLSSIIPSEESERVGLIHHYSHAFSGFSAMLTENEASTLSGHDGVVSVFPDPILKLHTTRSWDFLDSDLGMKLPHAIPTHLQQSSTHQDIIIALIDTGLGQVVGRDAHQTEKLETSRRCSQDGLSGARSSGEKCGEAVTCKHSDAQVSP